MYFLGGLSGRMHGSTAGGNYMFLLRCPKCRNQMKYHTSCLILAGKKKRCVYCGRTYAVKDNIVKKLG